MSGIEGRSLHEELADPQLREFRQKGVPVEVVVASDGSQLQLEARRMVASNYQVFNPNLSEKEIFEQLYTGEYERGNRSMTLVACDPKTGKLMATLRGTFGRQQLTPSDPQPIEAMQFFRPPGRWPHTIEGVSDDRIMESGRFAVSLDIRKLKKPLRSLVSARLLRDLSLSEFDIADQKGISQAYAIMPPNIYAFFVIEGIKPDLVSGGPIVENETVNMFPGYWKPENRGFKPALYRWKNLKAYGKR